MQVRKRDGKLEDVKFDKIQTRIKKLAFGFNMPDLNIEPALLAQKVNNDIKDGITTSELDNLLSGRAAMMALTDYDYGILAARVAVSSNHKETQNFYKTMSLLFKEGYLSEEFMNDVEIIGKKWIDETIDYNRDYNLDYFGFKTLERAYLLKVNGKPVERPQHLFMRVAIGIYRTDLSNVKSLYDYMSLGYYTHATPTLFNAGTKLPQMSSCFLVAMQDDSIEGIYNTKKDCAMISKTAGGIGLHIHNIRASGAPIKGTNGVSNGIVPMLKTFESDMWYVDQGGGKRKGSMAVYLEPWHADVEDFLLLRRKKATNFEKVSPEKVERRRTHDLNIALWIPDLFMKRLEANEVWTLMCPSKCPGLADVHSEEFEALYTKYEQEGRGEKTIKARDLWNLVLESQSDNGEPYIMFKDACNRKSNQKNLGTIKSSNLCVEIVEYSDPNETAVCNLASICLPKFVMEDGSFDFLGLEKVAKFATKSLNAVIDRNYYPTDKTERSNSRHRPISLGVQGLHDVFMMMGLPFDSEGAKTLNRQIFSVIYFGAACESVSIASVDGAYETYADSPTDCGKLQYDLWGQEPCTDIITKEQWDMLKEGLQEFGIRNSLLIGLMPTASSSQIFGNYESFDPMQANVFKRNVLSGEFPVINKYLVRDLKKLGIYTDEIKNKIIESDGSIQGITEIPENLRILYRTAFELPMRAIIDLAAGRGPYVCQSQSMNLFFDKPNFGKFSSALMYAWKQGLKTGSYYIRSKPAAQTQKITTTIEVSKPTQDKINQEAMLCSLDNPESCESCGS